MAIWLASANENLAEEASGTPKRSFEKPLCYHTILSFLLPRMGDALTAQVPRWGAQNRGYPTVDQVCEQKLNLVNPWDLGIISEHITQSIQTEKIRQT